MTANLELQKWQAQLSRARADYARHGQRANLAAEAIQEAECAIAEIMREIDQGLRS